MNRLSVIIMIAVSAAVTFFLRVLPFFVFSGDRKLPEWIDRLGQKLPPAIMAVLIVYCLKDMPDDLMTSALPRAAGVAVTVLSYRLKHNTLISLVLSTAAYMLLIRVL